MTYHYASEGVKGRYLGFSLDNAVNSTYSYDSYGRLNQINGLGGNFQYSYLANSELLENLTRPNGVSTQWNYEAHRDLITQVANGSVSTFDYVNDALERRTSMSRSGSAFTVPDILSYGYNDRSEVISAQSNTNSAYNYHYNYDPIGNRTTATLAGTNWNYTSNNLNQYTRLAFGDTVQEPTYDADGNMLTQSGWTQSWNGENRLIETAKGNIKLQFSYDYLGRRIEKKVYNGEVLTKHLRFVYNGYKLSEELDALNESTALRKYTWQAGVGLTVPLSIYDTLKNETYLYVTDSNKNISAITDLAGTIVAQYEYSPFGMIMKQSGNYATNNPFRFSGEFYDPETNLIYYNYRFYDSNSGKWLSREPLGEEANSNLSGFVKNNPISNYDLLGLLEFQWYGNWGGPGWAGGKKVDDGWNDSRNSNYIFPDNLLPPKDDLDQCYNAHDLCYENCRKKNRNCDYGLSRCFSDCDYKSILCQLNAAARNQEVFQRIQGVLGTIGLGTQGLVRDSWNEVTNIINSAWNTVSTLW